MIVRRGVFFSVGGLSGGDCPQSSCGKFTFNASSLPLAMLFLILLTMTMKRSKCSVFLLTEALLG